MQDFLDIMCVLLSAARTNLILDIEVADGKRELRIFAVCQQNCRDKLRLSTVDVFDKVDLRSQVDRYLSLWFPGTCVTSFDLVLAFAKLARKAETCYGKQFRYIMIC